MENDPYHKEGSRLKISLSIQNERLVLGYNYYYRRPDYYRDWCRNIPIS